MNLREFHIRQKAWELQRIQDREDMVLNAFISRASKATKKSGKFVVDKPEQIYDGQKERNMILGLTWHSADWDRLKKIAQNLKEFREKKKE